MFNQPTQSLKLDTIGQSLYNSYIEAMVDREVAYDNPNIDSNNLSHLDADQIAIEARWAFQRHVALLNMMKTAPIEIVIELPLSRGVYSIDEIPVVLWKTYKAENGIEDK